MQRLLRKEHQSATWGIDKPHNGAGHFLCQLKGTANFRWLRGCGEPPNAEEGQAHVREVVRLFMPLCWP